MSAEHVAVARSTTFEGSVTSYHVSPYGGGVAIVRVDEQAYRRAILPQKMLAQTPGPGERWRFTGDVHVSAEHGEVLQCRVALPLLPTGRGIVRLLAESKRFPGIGWRTAERLWAEFGVGLYDALRERDHAGLARVVGIERAGALTQGFGLLSVEINVLQWLDRYGVDGRTAMTAACLWGEGAIARIEANPYALSLLEPWSVVDERALRIGVHPTDDRRLLAAVEEACAVRWRQHHTASSRAVLVSLVAGVLGDLTSAGKAPSNCTSRHQAHAR